MSIIIPGSYPDKDLDALVAGIRARLRKALEEGKEVSLSMSAGTRNITPKDAEWQQFELSGSFSMSLYIPEDKKQ